MSTDAITEVTGRPGPLVEPGPALTSEQRARASRQIILPGMGDEAQRRLANARVLVIGAGGLGSASIPYLVGAGIGTIGIVDDDTVELSNLHRQITHTTADIGRTKTESLADAATRLDPAVRVHQHALRLSAANAREVLADYDLVIDGSDNFATRYLVNDAAKLVGIPLIWGAILQHHGQISVAWHAHGPGYRDLFPQPPEPGSVPSCSVGGVLPGLCGTIGSLLATEALKLITGTGTPLIGRVLIYDALAARFQELPYGRDPHAEPVTELIDLEPLCAPVTVQKVSATELAERMLRRSTTRLLDVREEEEWQSHRIRGSVWLPLSALSTALAADVEAFAVPKAEPVVVVCALGIRAQRAAAQLVAVGFTSVEVLAGGLQAFDEIAAEFVDRPGANDAASRILQEEHK